MEPSVLHKQAALYLEQDDCLYFALGLAKAAAEYSRWAEEVALREAASGEGASGEAASRPVERLESEPPL